MEDRQLIKYVARQFGILLSALLMIFKTKINQRETESALTVSRKIS